MDGDSEDDFGHGDDSFLDIVANLVGVMIILVVVLGVQSSKFVKASLDKTAADEIHKTLAEPTRVAEAYLQEVQKHEKELALYGMETQYREIERNKVLENNLILKEKINQLTASLDESRKQQIENFQVVTELEQKRNQLSIVLNDALSVANSENNAPIVLQHLPTPMARTVFTKELHLMVKQGRIAVIPWDPLVDALKKRVSNMVNSSSSSRKDRIRDQLGPIDGFIMEFSLVRKRGLMSNGYAQSIGELLSLEKFEIDATDEVVFESVAQAMSDGGRLAIELTRYNARDIVPTAWVYPDSFDAYRELKDVLFQRGFLSAARPIPEGVRIGAAPTGTKSVAQ